MITAAYLADSTAFREEFKNSAQIQPIDAPPVIPAGSVEHYDFQMIDGWTPMQTYFVREPWC